VVAVCTGNICRSPLAEALLARACEQRGVADVEVSSAGTLGQAGWASPPDVLEVATRRDVDLSHHRSRALGEADLPGAQLVLCAAEQHRRQVLAELPALDASRVVLMNDALPDAVGLDVLDPHGLDPATHELVAAVIERAMMAWAERLAADRT
jgi:protein-tyrosine phosphatase